MSSLTTNEKHFLENVLNMEGGYVLNFSDRTMGEFFRDDVGIDIYSRKYMYGSGSKANRIRGLWLAADDRLVGKSVAKLLDYIENQIHLGNLKRDNFSENKIKGARSIADKLLRQKAEVKNLSHAKFENGNIKITLQRDVFDHVQNLLNSEHYFNAVEEAYKVVREKLYSITGKERAHEAFTESNLEKIFGHKPRTTAESDFFEGVKFLHMSIQFLRNEKAHTPAKDLNKNLAIHYISLASLAYDLITRK